VSIEFWARTVPAAGQFRVPQRPPRRELLVVGLPLVALAVIAWIMTALEMSARSMPMTAAAFLAAWIVMMAAMMLPAVAPVVALYAQAARKGLVAALPVFLAGYLLVWALTGVPAFAVSRVVAEPLMDGEPWAARLVGGTLLLAAAYELTPLKAACLRHCRSPLSFFLSRRGSLASPRAALAAGAGHGLYCLGCCWALMAVLIAVGGMQLAWALALAAVLSLEKLVPRAGLVTAVAAVAAAVLGAALLVEPALLHPLLHQEMMS
jgi:predicted metal-binding membrane protein